MSNVLTRIIRVLVVLCGLAILIYPSLSEYLTEKNSSRVVASYDDSILRMEQARREEILAQAREYNRRLADVTAPLISENPGHEAALPEYWDILNVDSSGMMGYLSIPKISLSLPLYHGVEEAVLQVAVGHLQNTSLPVGGESTHAVLSGHRGLPSASLFTDLDRVEAGDQFFVKSLDQTLAYEVDQILTVEPHQVSSLIITPGEDYVTLVTCTPYGVNSHRLLIRGHRVPYSPEQAALIPEDGRAPTSWLLRLPTQYRHLLTGVAILSAILLLRLMILSMMGKGEYPASKREKF